jgi:hypothetical protein
MNRRLLYELNLNLESVISYLNHSYRSPTSTAPASTAPTLPPHQRRTAARWKAPELKPTNSYMFKGLHPLYTRQVIKDEHTKMLIQCSQPVISREAAPEA